MPQHYSSRISIGYRDESTAVESIVEDETFDFGSKVGALGEGVDGADDVEAFEDAEEEGDADVDAASEQMNSFHMGEEIEA